MPAMTARSANASVALGRVGFAGAASANCAVDAAGKFPCLSSRPSPIARESKKIGSFLGVVPAVVRAYAWIMSLGAEGLREVARVAVLNNNYLLHNILKIRGVSAPYAEGKRRIEQVRYSWQELYEQTGVRTGDITNRLCDHGMHMWASHHPFIVPNPMSLEPTESYSRAELDEYIAALESVSDESYRDPETVRSAPHRSCVHQTRHDSFDDPDRRAEAPTIGSFDAQ